MRETTLPKPVKRAVLACGSDTKASFVIANGSTAYLYTGYDDLLDINNFKRYKNDINKELKKLRIKPAIIAYDMHPGYFSSKFAEDFLRSTPYAVRNTKIQHHAAHIASAIAENRIRGKVLGIAFDGTGYGDDGKTWGGEFFAGDLKGLRRIAHLDYIKMPGIEASIKNPWQMGVSYLYKTFGKKIYSLNISFLRKIKKNDLDIVLKMIKQDYNSPKTSSVGRLFDAVSAILGLLHRSNFEAEAPVRLEEKAKLYGNTDKSYKFGINKKQPLYIIKPDDIIKGVVKDIIAGEEISYIAAKFHNTIATIILEVCRKLNHSKKVVLSGGVFLNKVLLNRTKGLLSDHGFRVYVQSMEMTGDAGISLGQAALANSSYATD